MARKAPRKSVFVKVALSIPTWMTAAEARREVRTLINDQSNYLAGKDVGGDFIQVDEHSVRATAVMAA